MRERLVVPGDALMSRKSVTPLVALCLDTMTFTARQVDQRAPVIRLASDMPDMTSYEETSGGHPVQAFQAKIGDWNLSRYHY